MMRFKSDNQRKAVMAKIRNLKISDIRYPLGMPRILKTDTTDIERRLKLMPYSQQIPKDARKIEVISDKEYNLLKETHRWEQDRNDYFADTLSWNRAVNLRKIWMNSYPSFDGYDRKVEKKEIFRIKAKRDGYTDKEIDMFMTL